MKKRKVQLDRVRLRSMEVCAWPLYDLFSICFCFLLWICVALVWSFLYKHKAISHYVQNNNKNLRITPSHITWKWCSHTLLLPNTHTKAYSNIHVDFANSKQIRHSSLNYTNIKMSYAIPFKYSQINYIYKHLGFSYM